MEEPKRQEDEAVRIHRERSTERRRVGGQARESVIFVARKQVAGTARGEGGRGVGSAGTRYESERIGRDLTVSKLTA